MTKITSGKYLFSFICFLLFVITINNSCKKDIVSQRYKIQDSVITTAKAWYENTYPRATVNKPVVQSTTTSLATDFSQIMKPDWSRAKNYNRFNKEVVEIPIDPSDKISSALKNMSTNRDVNNRNYSRSSFLLLYNGTNYDAYVMTIIADSAYLNDDLTKLNNNTYSKKDTDFSGLVFYFTPKGKFVSGWKYVGGKLITQNAKRDTSSTKEMQAFSDRGLKPTKVEPVCYDFYWVTYTDGVPTDIQYMYTMCYGGDAGGGAGPAAPPVTVCTVPSTHSIGKISVNNVPVEPTQPGDGNGLPSPTDSNPTYSGTVCPQEATITNKVTDPCLKNMVDLSMKNDISYSLTESMVSIFNNNTDFNLDFYDAAGSTFASATIDGTTQVDNVHYNMVGTRRIYDAMGLTITLNKSGLSQASQEYISATIMHEAFHAYLSYSHTIINQHIDMAQNYISVMTSQLMQMYPNLSASDAKALSWGGLEADASTLYKSLSSVERNAITIANKNYKSGKTGKPCTK